MSSVKIRNSTLEIVTVKRNIIVISVIILSTKRCIGLLALL